MKNVFVFVSLAALVAAGSGCSTDGSAATRTSTAGGEAPAPLPDLLASVGEEQVTLADVRARAGAELDKIETQFLLARSRLLGATVDSLVRERLFEIEQKRQGKSLDELIAAEIGGGEPSDVEIAAWYAANPNRVGGQPLDRLRGAIADHLRTSRRDSAVRSIEARVRREHSVIVNFEPHRLQFANDGAPAMGPANAPVTIVEFSDFQCPYCQRYASTLRDVERAFGDSVRIVFRQFPIASIHPHAHKAAEASLCANDQGKFRALHDEMFADPGRLTVADIKEKARRAGLDVRKLDACLTAGRHVERVQNDLAEGIRAGVTGTPAPFINGIPLGGAVSFDVMAAAIRAELDRTGGRR